MDVLQLKDNVIPRVLIPLEELFDQDYVVRKPTLVPTDKGVEDVNTGTVDKLKLLSYQKHYLLSQRLSMLSCFLNFLMFLHGITQI